MASLLLLNSASGQTPTGNTINFDEGWRFHRGGMLGAEKPKLDDSKWIRSTCRTTGALKIIPGTRSPFSPDAISQVGGGFTSQGTAWYRKVFNIPVADKAKRVVIIFDGVYMNVNVYINGEHLGNHPYG